MKGKNGTPSKDIPPAEVRALAAKNKTVTEIAKHFWCSRDTIHRNFSNEVAEGYALWNQATAKTLEGLAAIHCTTDEMAAVIGVSKDTLERNFLDVIHAGRGTGKASLRRTQWEAAQNIKDAKGKIIERGNAALQIWLGKQLLGQKEPRIELRLLSDDELATEIQRRLTLVPDAS